VDLRENYENFKEIGKILKITILKFYKIHHKSNKNYLLESKKTPKAILVDFWMILA